MELAESAGDLSFRAAVREFVRSALPADIAERTREVSFLENGHDVLAWMRILARKGWLVPHWPVEHGGLDWSPHQLHIFEEECALADAPAPNLQSLRMVGPVIYTFGSAEQKERFLPAIRAAEYSWAQGFSEPGAGSDLTALTTRAERVEGGWLVNGQKNWSSGAMEAEWAFLLVRTSREPKQQAGISFMVTRLDAPGITVRPIEQINGDDHFCEIFLEDVFIPDDQLIGEPGQGWRYAKFLLDHERTASAFVYWSKRQARQAARLLATEAGGRLGRDAVAAFRRRLTILQAKVVALEWSVLRVIEGEASRWHPSAIASNLKVSGAELQRELTAFQVDLLGTRALRSMPHSEHPTLRDGADELWSHEVAGITSLALITRASTIYGGAEQIQKNIIASVGLGL